MDAELARYETFWATIAQVAGTFIGLVLVAITVYATQVREVAVEVRKYRGFEEVSSPLVFALAISNLLLFWLPLMVAIAILGQIGPILLTFLLLTSVFVVARLTHRPETEFLEERKKPIQSSSSQHRFRAVFVRDVALSLTILQVVLLAILAIGPVWSSTLLGLLRTASVASIVLGVVLSVYDLQLFDQRNIVLRVTAAAKSQTAARLMRLNDSLINADQALQYLLGYFIQNPRWQASVVARIATGEIIYSEENFRKKLSETKGRLLDDLATLRQQVASFTDDLPEWMQNQLRHQTDYILYADFLGFYNHYRDMQSDIADFQVRVERVQASAERATQSRNPIHTGES